MVVSYTGFPHIQACRPRMWGFFYLKTRHLSIRQVPSVSLSTQNNSTMMTTSPKLHLYSNIKISFCQCFFHGPDKSFLAIAWSILSMTLWLNFIFPTGSKSLMGLAIFNLLTEVIESIFA